MASDPKVKWLLEEGTFVDDIQPVVDEIQRQGMVVETTKYNPLNTEKYDQFEPDDCVIVLGSIGLVKQIQRQKPWIPGCFSNFTNFDCMNYYAHYGEYLLNKDYYIMPLGEVKRRYDNLSSELGKLFIRPCSGAKNFTGQILDIESLTKHESKYGKPELPVVVSSAKDIRQEYRIFCSGDRVIAGSMYYDSQGELNPKALKTTCEEMDQNIFVDDYNDIAAICYAEYILKNVSWKPDKIFCMDIGLTPLGPPRLIELNSFSCSGWYQTPPKMMIYEASRQAIIEWKEINNI